MGCVILLIRAEFMGLTRQIYLFKPLATLLVISLVIVFGVKSGGLQLYSGFILAGLLFALGGDVALMFSENKDAFRIGLVLFLITHLFYATIFTWYTRFTAGDIIPGIVLAVAAVLIYRILHLSQSGMSVPVSVYIIAISYMVSRALATWESPFFNRSQALLVSLGVGLFYVSDLMLAINRFRRPYRLHHISLLFYYAGQTLIACSAVR